ncbi:unnamed protein product [Phytophthora fragariaefolia]|uniref:Unnamed protein product n=1 Tax=Phytophthora fragariaefolia TaxID=1490495 RepID=A0A9W6YQF0_9STRA|nr:unnamed protein product [Phytophthora fragariaefolia]
MNIYGQSNFDMYACPIVPKKQDSVLYNVFATFIEDSTERNYTLVDGVAYLTTPSLKDNAVSPSVTCLDAEPDTLPPITTIVRGLSEAVAVSSASGSGSGAAPCTNGNLFKVLVNGIAFVLCTSGSSGFTMIGDDMDIIVSYLDHRVEIDKPSVNVGSTLKCQAVSSASPLTVLGRALLTGESTLTNLERKLKSEFDVTFWDDDDDSSEASSREGSCSLLNTVDNAWTNVTLQQQVCDRAVSVSKRSSKTVIADTSIITHSMGNLMVGGAIATGKCKLDSSSTWVGLAGPMQGSMASDFVRKTCAGETNFVLEKVANVTGRCPPTVALKSLPSQGGNYSSTELNEAYTAAQKAYTSNVSALMRSAGYSGLKSKYQAEFWVLGSAVPYKSGKNDGMVEFESCAAGFPDSKFGDTWRSPFYKKTQSL